MDSATERGPPATYDHILPADIPDRRRLLGVSARPNPRTTPAIYNYDDLAQFVQTARGGHGVAEQGGSAEAADPALVPRSDVAAKTAPGTAIRPVGSVLGHVDDVMANPRLLEGVHPAQLENIMRGTPGWEFGVLGRGRSAGSGWTARELKSAGTDFTGRYI